MDNNINNLHGANMNAQQMWPNGQPMPPQPQAGQQPMPQQPIMQQPIQQPMQMQTGQPEMITSQPINYAYANNPVNKPKTNKKIFIIGGVAIAAIAAIVGIAIAINNNNNNALNGAGGTVSGVKKTLTCKSHTGIIGLVSDMTYTFKIGDGKIKQFIIAKDQDLDGFDYWAKEYGYGGEEEYVAQNDKSAKEECANDGCVYKSNYVKGKSYKWSITYSDDAVNNSILGDTSGASKYTAQEIADLFQESFEGENSPLTSEEFAGVVTCEQN